MKNIIETFKKNTSLTILVVGVLVVLYSGYDLFNIVQTQTKTNILSQPTFDIIGKYFNK